MTSRTVRAKFISWHSTKNVFIRHTSGWCTEHVIKYIFWRTTLEAAITSTAPKTNVRLYDISNDGNRAVALTTKIQNFSLTSTI